MMRHDHVITTTQNTNQSQVSVVAATVHSYVLNLRMVLCLLALVLLTVLVRVTSVMD